MDNPFGNQNPLGPKGPFEAHTVDNRLADRNWYDQLQAARNSQAPNPIGSAVEGLGSIVGAAHQISQTPKK